MTDIIIAMTLGVVAVPAGAAAAWVAVLAWTSITARIGRCRRGHLITPPDRDESTDEVGALWTCEECGRSWVITTRAAYGNGRAESLRVKDVS
jgi:histidinol dehydrogenase